MQERYSLSHYRGKNIVEPITEEQVGFSFLTNKLKAQICELRRLIKEDVYGCYLVSGMKGVGKTSFINIALSNLGNRPQGKEDIIVRLNAVKLSEVNELFSLLIKELLFIAKDRESPLNAFCTNIEIIYFINEGILKTTVQGQAALELAASKILSIEKDAEIGIDTDRITKSLFKVKSNLKCENKNQLGANAGLELKGTLEYVRQEKPDVLFRDMLNEFEQSGLRLILVLDEIDKCEKSFIEEVFRQYKDLLINYKMFCFFITDESVFADSVAKKNNCLDTYFIRKFYLPLLSYEETMQYYYRHFCEEAISSVDILYYLTLGNTRALNINYKMRLFANTYRLDEVVLLYKARLFQYIMDNIQYELDEEDVRNLKSDFLKIDIKAFIEYIFDERECPISGAVDYYNRIKTNRYPKAEDILECMRNYKDKLELQIMKFVDDKIHICFDADLHVCVVDDHIEINDKNGAGMQCDNKIEIKTLFPFYEEGYQPRANSFGSIRFVKLGDNEKYAYRDALRHILISSYYSICELIFVKRVRDNSFKDEEYSIFAVIDDGLGTRNVYYNEAGSYSDEDTRYALDFLEEMKKLGVTYSERIFDRGEKFEDIILHIEKSLQE